MNGETAHFIWDGANIIMELEADSLEDIANGNYKVTDSLTRGIGLIHSERNGYFIHNAHGDVTKLMGADGKIYREYFYDVFGNPLGYDVLPPADDAQADGTEIRSICDISKIIVSQSESPVVNIPLGGMFDKLTLTAKVDGYGRIAYYEASDRTITRENGEAHLPPNTTDYEHSKVRLKILLDGREAYNSGTLNAFESRDIELDLTGKRKLTLIAENVDSTSRQKNRVSWINGVLLRKADTGVVIENDDNVYRYCGEFLDLETGNIYLRNRMYNPRTGRFTQEDPIRDGLNFYTYCGNNPIRFADPWGLSRTPVPIDFDEPEEDVEERTVWIRDLVEAAGGTIEWCEETRAATVTIGGVTRAFDERDWGTYITEDGRMMIDGMYFAASFYLDLGMEFETFSGDGFDGFMVAWTRAGFFSSETVIGTSFNIHNTVEGERFANSINNDQNALASLESTLITTALGIASTIVGGYASGGAVTAIGFALGIISAFKDSSQQLRAGETFISRSRYASYLGNPVISNTAMVRDVNGQIRSTHSGIFPSAPSIS